MASRVDHVTEQPARLQAMIDEFQAARQRRLEKQGRDLWNRTEKTYRNAAVQGEPPPVKLN